MSINETTEIIKIEKSTIGQENVSAVNSREIYEYLEVDTKYSMWIQRAIEKYDFEMGVDYVSTLTNPKSGKRDFIVTMDMAKELCMVSNTEKGKETRKYFIAKEKEATQTNKPLTIEQLLQENMKVIGTLQTQVIELKEKVEVDSPKVLFADSVAQSESSILIGQFAKAISDNDFSIGQNRLFDWLRENGYLISSGSRKNQPMQQYIENGYFEVVERSIINPDGSSRITTTTKIKGKGQVALAKKIKQA